MRNEVKHDMARNQFYLERNGKRALLDYRRIKEGLLEYHRTFVPRALRKQGLASSVVHAALEYAKEHEYKIIPACSFVKYYIAKNQQYQILVDKHQ